MFLGRRESHKAARYRQASNVPRATCAKVYGCTAVVCQSFCRSYLAVSWRGRRAELDRIQSNDSSEMRLAGMSAKDRGRSFGRLLLRINYKQASKQARVIPCSSGRS